MTTKLQAGNSEAERMTSPVFLSSAWIEGKPHPRVIELDRELRLRGVPMWRDVRDLFAGGLNETEAYRAIDKDCCGCILYFTEKVLDSWFIKSVEMEVVQRRLDRDQDFFLAAVFDGVAGCEAEELRTATGVDVGSFHGLFLDPATSIDDQLREFSSGLLRRYLAVNAGDDISVKIDSWKNIPWTDPATLHLNWVGTDAGSGLLPAAWELLKHAVTDVREALDGAGERRLSLTGNAHLGSAFLLGWEFREPTGWSISADHPRAPIEMELVGPNKQGWSMIARPSQNDSDVLVARVCASANPSRAVRRHRQDQSAARADLVILPPGGTAERTSLEDVDLNGLASAIVGAVREARELHDISSTHLYLACPWTLALALGWNFASSGSVVIHEATADKATYHPNPLRLP